jgi:hypothetical protein
LYGRSVCLFVLGLLNSTVTGEFDARTGFRSVCMRSNESSLSACIPTLPIVLNEIRPLFGLTQPFRIAYNVLPNIVPLRVLWTVKTTYRGLAPHISAWSTHTHTHT